MGIFKMGKKKRFKIYIEDKLKNEKPVFSNNMMEEMFNEKKIQIYTSQLVKKVSNQEGDITDDHVFNEEELTKKNVGFSIYQRYLIKVFN